MPALLVVLLMTQQMQRNSENAHSTSQRSSISRHSRSHRAPTASGSSSTRRPGASGSSSQQRGGRVRGTGDPVESHSGSPPPGDVGTLASDTSTRRLHLKPTRDGDTKSLGPDRCETEGPPPEYVSVQAHCSTEPYPEYKEEKDGVSRGIENDVACEGAQLEGGNTNNSLEKSPGTSDQLGKGPKPKLFSRTYMKKKCQDLKRRLMTGSKASSQVPSAINTGAALPSEYNNPPPYTSDNTHKR